MTIASDRGAYTGHRIVQVGLIVTDLEAAIDAYRSAFGWGPWRVYEMKTPSHRNLMLHGEPIADDVTIRLAIADAGGIDIELIQPISGPSQHADYLEKHGPGINHILVRQYESGEEVQIDPRRFGLPIVMEADFGPVHYAYVDGGNSLQTLIEVAHGSTAALGMVPDQVIP